MLSIFLCTCIFLCVMYWPFIHPWWNVSANSPFFDRVLCLIKLWEFFRYTGSNVLLDTCLANIFPCLWLDFSFYFFNGSACSFREKAMATHSSTLAWKIPWAEEPGRLQSMGSLSRSRLSDFTFTFHFHALEKEMATHSSVLAWRILGTGEPGGLPSMGSHRFGHDWSDLAAAAVCI